MGLYCKCLDLAPGLRPGADPGDLCPGGTDPEALASPFGDLHEVAPGLRPGADPGDLSPEGLDPGALASPFGYLHEVAPGLRPSGGWALYRTLCPISMIRPWWLLAYAFSLINKAGPWCFSEFLHLYICFYIYIYIRRDIMGLYCKCLDLAPGLRPGRRL